MKLLPLLTVLLVACSSTPTPVKNATTTGVACAKVDLTQIVEGAGEALKFYIDDLINASPTSLEADLSALAQKIGADAVICAIEAYQAGITSFAPSGTGLSRAKVWADSQR